MTIFPIFIECFIACVQAELLQNRNGFWHPSCRVVMALQRYCVTRIIGVGDIVAREEASAQKQRMARDECAVLSH